METDVNHGLLRKLFTPKSCLRRSFHFSHVWWNECRRTERKSEKATNEVEVAVQARDCGQNEHVNVAAEEGLEVDWKIVREEIRLE